MGFLVKLFNLTLYQPLFNILIFLYQYLPGRDFGLAVITLTLIIKILLYPLGVRAIKIQKSLQVLQPKIKEIQTKYKENPKQQSLEMLALYKKEKINPFSGLAVSLVQIPILIALWRVFWQGFQPEKLAVLYSFVPRPTRIDPTFMGILNLSTPSIFLAVLAGVTQFFQTKMISSLTSKSQKKEKSQLPEIMEKQMLYFFPIFTFLILLKLPAALGLYWLVSSLFSIVQQYFILKKVPAPTKNYA